MRPGTNVGKIALAASWLFLAACGSNADLGLSRNADGLSSSTKSAKDATSATDGTTASPSGTTIPSATQIIDSSGNGWTVAAGVIYETGALAGYSNAVTLLLYANDLIYQENSAGGWWSWNGNTWVSDSDPRLAASPSGTTIPSAAQIVDGSGDVWAVSGGLIYENGVLAGYPDAVTLLVYETSLIYQENSAGGWWSWNGSTWIESNDPRSAASPSGTAIPSAAQIVDGSGNVWTVAGGVVYENGTTAGYSNGVTELLYENGLVYQENSSGNWWSWNGGTWARHHQ